MAPQRRVHDGLCLDPVEAIVLLELFNDVLDNVRDGIRLTHTEPGIDSRAETIHSIDNPRTNRPIGK